MKHSGIKTKRKVNRAQRRREKSQNRARSVVCKHQQPGRTYLQSISEEPPALTLPDIPVGREKIGGCDWLDWNQLSALGLMVRINVVILHPLGLAVFRDPDSGILSGAMIAPDGKWAYAPDVIEAARERLSDHSGKHGHS
ncbi:TPA: hypothetical protein ACNAHW_004285 [Klebsiella pneumoniae]